MMWGDQDRYEEQLKEFETKGFFLNKDGTKALETDPKKKYGKNVVLPKKARNAFSYFVSKNVGLVKGVDGYANKAFK